MRKIVILALAFIANIFVANAQKKDSCDEEKKSIIDFELLHLPGIPGNQQNPSEKGGKEISLTVAAKISKNLIFVSSLKYVNFGSHIYNRYEETSNHEKMSWFLGVGVTKKINEFFGEVMFSPMVGGYWQDGFEPNGENPLEKKVIGDQQMILSKGLLIRNEFLEIIFQNFKKKVEVDGHLDLPSQWRCSKKLSFGINFGTVNGVRILYNLTRKWTLRSILGGSHSNPVFGFGFEFQN